METRKKSAILVGCGYYRTRYERFGCENDVKIIEEVLLNQFGFLSANITKLIETNQPNAQPTMANIQNALNNMKSNAREGDVLFFYFSGRVTVNDQPNNIPALRCCDKRLLSATDFRYEDNQLPEKTSFTLVLESSHSVGFINPVTNDNNRILFSACRENEEARRVELGEDNKRTYGVFTNAIQMVVNESPPPISNEQLLGLVNRRIGFHQHAGLYCNADNRNANFLDWLPID